MNTSVSTYGRRYTPVIGNNDERSRSNTQRNRSHYNKIIKKYK